jgi:hypothetical protein
MIEIDQGDPIVLRMLLLPDDPSGLSAGATLSNVILIWAESEAARRNARYFYDDIKTDPAFDGGGWYSSRSWLRGEKVTIANVDAAGHAKWTKTVRVGAFSMKLAGFTGRTNVPAGTPQQ